MTDRPIEPKKESGAVANPRATYRAAIDRVNRATDAEIDRAVADLHRKLAAAQEPLGEPFASILAEHAWDLYAR